MSNLIYTRRRLLRDMSLAAGIAAVGLRPAHAADEQITATAYGGVWEESARKAFVADFEQRTTAKVNILLGTPAQWLSQIEASPASPPIDVLITSPELAILAGRGGLAEKLTVDKVPAVADIVPQAIELCEGWASCVAYSAYGFAYHSRIGTPPKSIEEFIDGTEKGRWKAALPNASQPYTPAQVIWSFADILGGSIDNVDPAFEALKRMKSNTLFWNGYNDALVALESGEADITIFPDGRAYAHFDAGADWMRFVNPTDKAPMAPSVVQKVKNGKDLGWEYINSILSDGPQGQFARLMNYSMSNQKVRYDPPLDKRVINWNDVRIPPYAKIADVSKSWIDRWNREIGG